MPLAVPLDGFLVLALLRLGQSHEEVPVPQPILHGLPATGTGLTGHVLRPAEARTFSLPPFIPLAETTVVRFGIEGRAQSTFGGSLPLLLLRELGNGLHPSLRRVLVTTVESMLVWWRPRVPAARVPDDDL